MAPVRERRGVYGLTPGRVWSTTAAIIEYC